MVTIDAHVRSAATWATCVLALLCTSERAARAVESLSLQEVLSRVAERGPDEAVIDAALPLAEADLHEARMFPNPAIALSAGRAEPVFSGGVQLRLPIFGTRGAHVAAAQRAVESAARDQRWKRLQLRHDAEVAYWGVARTEAARRGAEAAAELAHRVADIAHERFSVGAGNRLDDRQALLVWARAQQEIVDRRQAEVAARIELARLVGSGDVAERPLADTLDHARPNPPLDALLEKAHAHAELKRYAAQHQVAAAQLRAAFADRRPVPLLEVGAEVLDPSTCGGRGYCAGPRVGLTFDVPLFHLNGGPIDRARAELHLLDAEQTAATIRIEADVRIAYAHRQAAAARVHFYADEYVPNANEVEAMAREGFSEGRSGLLPLVEAERAVLEARLGLSDAQYDVQVATADLEEAVGDALP